MRRRLPQLVADVSGKLLLINPTPGQLGTLPQLYLNDPGSFRLDFGLVKRVKIRESVNFEFRSSVRSDICV
jgi:hypothetical protein